ncbi:electron transfer flavoprotein subunit alpha/FixB family protein [Halanaerobiaceae bacterium Z-7014]|uniref:Electron transfer flavoprotein subunit alpha/FixB family protein n=1 Tax=Halonatronomonas betaini TaxID=2778430 RepID=A0A931FAX6_9FIRM|nr:electron transfer flavoprotein subunit alpha/FixB family protein [Halonatronomonas betaini]MBF8437412.1 electron transfer flavoprotein subunit alpha/FixB family protein [Halonatronomonas betaini]
MSYNGVWTMAETNDGKLRTVAFELLTRGRKLADKLDVDLSSFIIGNNVSKEEANKLIEAGADKVYLMNDPRLEDFIVENYSNVMVSLVEEYKPEIILGAATTQGRTVLPHVAIRVNAGLTADCTELDIEEESGNLLQTRPAIGGNILATIHTPKHRPQMATVRPKSTSPAERVSGREGEIIELDFDPELLDGRAKRVDFRTTEGEDVNIVDADTIVAGGKGLKKSDNFEMIWKMADILGGAVGASRDAVEMDWISYPHQVGLSGKTVTPHLYIAIGISGAIQHLAGMKTADHIIAINEDPDADIFKVSDIGIVGNLFDLVPMINERLQEEVEKVEV